jgi:hypothetical protein
MNEIKNVIKNDLKNANFHRNVATVTALIGLVIIVGGFLMFIFI